MSKEILDKGLDKEIGESTNPILFALYLLHEKAQIEKVGAESSDFGHYLDIFPSSFTNYPVFFTNDEFHYLAGSLTAQN